MVIITPAGFWRRYKEEIIAAKPTLEKYKDNDTWTKLTADAARRVIRSTPLDPIGEPLTASKEYFRVDVIGEEKIDPEWNWLLRIAFEHENEYAQNQWMQELCKLTHVVADLRVLAAYYDSSEEAVRAKLQERINLLQSHSHRVTRVPNSEWLFIFGPADKAKDEGAPFLTFTLRGMTVERLPDNTPLIPKAW